MKFSMKSEKNEMVIPFRTAGESPHKIFCPTTNNLLIKTKQVLEDIREQFGLPYILEKAQCMLVGTLHEENNSQLHPHTLGGEDCEKGIFKRLIELDKNNSSPTIKLNKTNLQKSKKSDYTNIMDSKVEFLKAILHQHQDVDNTFDLNKNCDNTNACSARFIMRLFYNHNGVPKLITSTPPFVIKDKKELVMTIERFQSFNAFTKHLIVVCVKPFQVAHRGDYRVEFVDGMNKNCNVLVAVKMTKVERNSAIIKVPVNEIHILSSEKKVYLRIVFKGTVVTPNYFKVKDKHLRRPLPVLSVEEVTRELDRLPRSEEDISDMDNYDLMMQVQGHDEELSQVDVVPVNDPMVPGPYDFGNGATSPACYGTTHMAFLTDELCITGDQSENLSVQDDDNWSSTDLLED